MNKSENGENVGMEVGAKVENRINITVRCPKAGCPRSISYCFKCDDMKGIESIDWNNDRKSYAGYSSIGSILTCGWTRKAT